MTTNRYTLPRPHDLAVESKGVRNRYRPDPVLAGLEQIGRDLLREWDRARAENVRDNGPVPDPGVRREIERLRRYIADGDA